MFYHRTSAAYACFVAWIAVLHLTSFLTLSSSSSYFTTNIHTLLALTYFWHSVILNPQNALCFGWLSLIANPIALLVCVYCVWMWMYMHMRCLLQSFQQVKTQTGSNSGISPHFGGLYSIIWQISCCHTLKSDVQTLTRTISITIFFLHSVLLLQPQTEYPNPYHLFSFCQPASRHVPPVRMTLNAQHVVGPFSSVAGNVWPPVKEVCSRTTHAVSVSQLQFTFHSLLLSWLSVTLFTTFNIVTCKPQQVAEKERLQYKQYSIVSFMELS